MTLVNRLTLFSLLLVLAVLAGFSVLLFTLAKFHLEEQAHARVNTALDTIGAAIEIKSNCVVWEPEDRHVQFSATSWIGETFIWVVADPQSTVVARSENPVSAEILWKSMSPGGLPPLDQNDANWLTAHRWVRPTAEQTAIPRRSGITHGRHERFPALVIRVGLSRDPLHSMLRKLAMMLFVVSTIVCLLSFVAVRWICRRGLWPVRKMATAAQAIGSADWSARLPRPGNRDELDDLARSFNELLDRLQESLERQRSFTGDASHQLRTPLAGILGQIEVSQRRDRTVAEYQDTLRLVSAQADQLRRIVESLLFLARNDNDAMVPDREQLDLATWLGEQLRSWSTHPRFPDMQMTCGPDVGAVWAHPVILGELLKVILDNACRYSNPGTPIRLEARRHDGTIVLDVVDHGIGIDPSELPNIFAPFFRSTRGLSANRQGVGLGLSIAMRLARALGATLTASSDPSEGTRFRVNFS